MTEPIVPHFVCTACNRRHSTRSAIGRAHLIAGFARAPKRS